VAVAVALEEVAAAEAVAVRKLPNLVLAAILAVALDM